MEKDKIQELLEARAFADQELERMRSAITILFTDIKGSTAYFEKHGDIVGLAMVQRHNDLLFPVVRECGGRIVKTIGDAIMAAFENPVGAVKASVGMMRALDADNKGRSDDEQIHIKVGLHTGLGLQKDNDVYGDVVNAAARVQHQAEPDQILITEMLLDAAAEAGVQVAKMGRAVMKGKDEPIDVYAVAWSASAGDQLIATLQSQFEKKLKDARRQQDRVEEELENARAQWRSERRQLTAEIEQLEESIERAKEAARTQITDELQSEIRFQLEEAVRARQQVEQELIALQAKSEIDKNNLKAQIAAMQGSVIEAMEKSNNPTRLALAVREQVDARLKEAKQDWQLEFEGERRRLTAEIERLKKAASPNALDEKKEAARRALLEKLGKLPAGSAGPGPKTADQLEKDFNDAKINWETQKEGFELKIQRLERDLQQAKDEMRSEIYQELRAQYEPRMAEANRERKRLEEELQALNGQFTEDRTRMQSRIEQLERAIPEAQESARKQATAELKAQFDAKIDEINRVKARNERRFQDSAEEWEAERRRATKEIAQLKEELKDAKEAAFKAQRSAGRAPSSE